MRGQMIKTKKMHAKQCNVFVTQKGKSRKRTNKSQKGNKNQGAFEKSALTINRTNN